MPGHTPQVSVLLPVYNAEAYLAEAIESILDQSFRDFELLILDDGSGDASPSIAAGYVERDDRVRLSVRENRGLTHTLNELIANARGEYVARMDADDASLPERFAMQVARLDEEPDIVVLGGHAIYMDEAGRPIFSPELPLGHHEIDRLNLGGRTALVHPSVMMRKVAVQEIGGYAPRFNGAEDLDLWLRLAEHGRLANLREIVLRYRLVGSSVSGQRRAEQAAMTRAACEAAWARRDLPARSVSDGDWRPGPDRASRRDFALKWAWQAWRAGNRGTARRFFLKALQVDPLSAEAWKGMVFGSFRRPRAGEQGASRR